MSDSIKETRYALQYKENGQFVALDHSSGGYPCPAKRISDIWTADREIMEKYLQAGFIARLKIVKVNLHLEVLPEETARTYSVGTSHRGNPIITVHMRTGEIPFSVNRDLLRAAGISRSEYNGKETIFEFIYHETTPVYVGKKILEGALFTEKKV